MSQFNYSLPDFVQFTKILSADVNTKLGDIKTAINGTLDTYNFANKAFSMGSISNLSVTASVAASALTITVNDLTNAALSSTNIGKAVFRNATAGTGAPAVIGLTSSVSMTVSSGSTLGHTNAVAAWIYVYLINNAGTAEVAVSSTPFDEGSLVSTTAEGGSGGADTFNVMYSTTARTNVGCRLVGRLKSTQTTAGTWATAPSEISAMPVSLISTLNPSLSTMRICSAYIDGTSGDPADITRQDGNWISSVTHGSTGIYTVNVRTGIFSNNPNVTVSADVNARLAYVATASTTAIGVKIVTVDGGVTASNQKFFIMAIGPA